MGKFNNRHMSCKNQTVLPREKYGKVCLVSSKLNRSKATFPEVLVHFQFTPVGNGATVKRSA